MAVENLYNTAVEYHSPVAAEPPPRCPQTWSFAFRAWLSKHISVQDQVCRSTIRLRASHMKIIGRIVVAIDSDACLLFVLCFLSLLTLSHSGPQMLRHENFPQVVHSCGSPLERF